MPWLNQLRAKEGVGSTIDDEDSKSGEFFRHAARIAAGQYDRRAGIGRDASRPPSVPTDGPVGTANFSPPRVGEGYSAWAVANMSYSS